MKIIINFSVKESIFFSDYPRFFHSLFSNILIKNQVIDQKSYKKKNYTFTIPNFKILLPNKVYKIEFISNDQAIINCIKENLQKSNLIKESFLQEVPNTYTQSGVLKIENGNFLLSENIRKNWGVNVDLEKISTGKKININFTFKKHSAEILKEILEYHISDNYNKLGLSPELPLIAKAKNGKEISNIIESIEPIKSHYKVIKNASIPCVDFKIKFKSTANKRVISNIANFLLNEGCGNKGSFGFGFVREIK